MFCNVYIKFEKGNANLFYQTNENIARLSSRIKVQRKSTSQGETMAICKRCNVVDHQHEVKMPNKRFVVKNGKKEEICEGFQSFDPKILESILDPTQTVLPKVIT